MLPQQRTALIKRDKYELQVNLLRKLTSAILKL